MPRGQIPKIILGRSGAVEWAKGALHAKLFVAYNLPLHRLDKR